MNEVYEVNELIGIMGIVMFILMVGLAVLAYWRGYVDGRDSLLVGEENNNNKKEV